MISCKKRSFLTKEKAVLKIKEIAEREKNTRKPIPVRYYMCPKCGLYHLTSFTKSKQRMVINRKINAETNRIEREAEYWIKKKQLKNLEI